jgi:hypothetical protein
MSLARLASLQLANIVVEYQIVWRLLADLNIERERDLATVLRGLVTAARWTLLELDATILSRMHAWYGHGNTALSLKSALAGMGVGVALLSPAGVTPAHVLIRHFASDTAHTPHGEPLCTRLADLLTCADTQRRSDGVSGGPLCSVKELDTPITSTRRLHTTHAPRTHATKRRPKPIPVSVCGTAPGMVVELVKACMQAPRSAQLWVYENDGFYKCRNATHWLSGCLQLA